MADVKTLAEQLVGLTVKEVQELADVLKADYGIEPAAAAVVVAGGGGGAAAAAEEKSTFDVILVNQVINSILQKIKPDLSGFFYEIFGKELPPQIFVQLPQFP